MSRRTLLIVAALILPAYSIAAVPTLVSAQAPANTAPGQALEIAPPLLTVSANPGETVKREISLRNISGSSLLVKGQVNDFVAAGEDGTPKIIFEDDLENPNPRSIKKWIAPLATLTTTPRQIKKLPLTIHVPKNASPGGYYGVVRFTATPPDLEDTGVSLSASVGSLVLLTVNGQTKESMSIAEFSVNNGAKAATLFEHTPLNFVLRMKNEGNVHDQPRGQAGITDMFGNRIAVINFNQPPRNILPGDIRKFTSPLDSSVIGNKMLFGKYTADLKMTYGTNKQVVTSTLTFWVIPYRLMAIAITALIIGFFVLRFAIKRYNQSIINKAQGGSSKKK